jgi:small GTP-binding protein
VPKTTGNSPRAVARVLYICSLNNLYRPVVRAGHILLQPQRAMSAIVKQIENILQKELVQEPSRNGDPLANLMPAKNKTLRYALDDEGHLVGLNLAGAAINDTVWKKLIALPGLTEHLRGLNLRGNELTEFPFPETGGLRRLEQLRLAENKIRNFSLPKGMNSLRDLDLEENPLISPPPDVVKLGKQEILKWLTDTGKRPVLEAKVMFIGDSNYGKTHLIEMLLHQEIKRTITTTHGIERCRMRDASTPDGPIRLNIWDLGGQQFMRSTHQFFFTERTLYVLVTVARRERKDLNHWLQLVKEIGGDAPVLVVINKTDLDEHDIDREPLRRAYPNIVGFVRTAVFDNLEKNVVAINTIRELEEKIHQTVSSPDIMPSVFVEQRPEWFAVKKDLESMNVDYISYEKYRQLKHVKDLDDDEKRTNLKQLASLGTVVSFVDDPRLLDTHVINPQWIMDGVYTLINDTTVKDIARGKFNFSDLERLLPARRYPGEKFPFLVDLMEKFKLCYPVGRDRTTFLLPDLFSDIEPADVWPAESNGLKMRFNYGSFPPDLFMAQFIVESYASIVDDKRWRSGVVVSNQRCTAIVRRAFSDEHIELEVVGPEKERRGYLHELLAIFRKLHAPFENLEVEREIPYESVWLNYDHLLTFEEENKPFFHPVLRKDIPVSAVLDGYERPEKIDSLAEILSRIENNTLLLIHLGEKHSRILEQLSNNELNRNYLFETLEKGLDEISKKLPANDPLVQQTKVFKTAPDLKTKIKLGVNLLFFSLEKEISWDMKAVFKQIAADMKNGHIFTKS